MLFSCNSYNPFGFTYCFFSQHEDYLLNKKKLGLYNSILLLALLKHKCMSFLFYGNWLHMFLVVIYLQVVKYCRFCRNFNHISKKYTNLLCATMGLILNQLRQLFKFHNFKDLLHKTLALPRQENVGEVQNSLSSLANFRHFTTYR